MSDELQPLHGADDTRNMHVDATRARPRLQPIADSWVVLQALLDSHSDGVAILVDTAFAYVNDTLCHLLGYDADTLLRTNPFAHIAPYDRDRAAGRLRAVLAGEQPVLATYDCLRRDGTTFPIEVLSSRPISYGARPALLLTVRDQTDRRDADATLRASELRFRTLFEQAPIGIGLLSPEGRYLQVNESLCQILGYTSAELRDRTFVDLTHPDDRAGTPESARKVFEDADLIVRLNKRYLRKNGDVVHAETTVSIVRDDEGQVLYALTMVEDVTERRAVEEQLERSVRVESVGQLAAGVAHNFNNALMAISGYSELIAGRLADDDPSRHDITQIQQVTEHSAGLTRQLLAFSRKERLEPTVFCLNETVRRIADLLTSLLGDPFSIDVDLDPDLPEVSSDPSQMEQVVTNLVLNARDAMSNGGVIRIETNTCQLDGDTSRTHADATPGRYVRLVVADTGSGMDETTAARVFEPFFTTKEPGTGVGLGLSMVHGTVRQHGGFIELQTEPQVGTRFSVYLPALT